MTRVKASLREIVSCASYFRFWSGQVGSQIGDALSVVAIPLLAYELGGSITTVALTLFTGAIAWIVVCPAAGILADRVNRAKLLIAVDMTRAVLSLLLILVQSERQFYLLVFCLAASEAIFRPAQAAMIPALVHRDLYQRAIGWSYAAFHAAKGLGLVLASLLLSMGASSRSLISVDAMSFVVAAYSTWLATRGNDSFRGPAKTDLNSFKELPLLLSDVLHDRLCVNLTILTCLYVSVQPLIISASFRASQLLAGDAFSTEQFYSVLASVLGFGAISGALFASGRSAFLTNVVPSATITVIGMASMLASSFATYPLLQLVGFLAFGISFGAVYANEGAALAMVVSNERRGRVYGLINALLYIFTSVGALLAHQLQSFSSAALLQIASIIIGSGALIIITVSAGSPSLRRPKSTA